MGWTIPPVRQPVLFHYSEDPGIEVFAPHVPRTNPTATAAVWAIDAARAPLYWFPRNCPRVAVWANDDAQLIDLRQRFGTGPRVQAAPASWSDRIVACTLFEYRFDGTQFEPWDDAEGQWISVHEVRPLSVVPVGDLLARHRVANVDLRFEPDLTSVRDAALTSGLPFSIVRFRD